MHHLASSTENRTAAIAAPAPHSLGKRILYVDDEPLLARLGVEILQPLGYDVEAHTHAPDALSVLRNKPAAYDLLITDQAMPKLLGTDLAIQARALRPELPIILMTGYAPMLTPEYIKTIGIQVLVLKPFSVVAFVRVVARVLAAADPAVRNSGWGQDSLRP